MTPALIPPSAGARYHGDSEPTLLEHTEPATRRFGDMLVRGPDRIETRHVKLDELPFFISMLSGVK